MASNEYCYLDFPQIQGQRNWGWMKTTTLQKCYEQDPAFGKPEKEADQKRKQTISSAFRAPCGENISLP